MCVMCASRMQSKAKRMIKCTNHVPLHEAFLFQQQREVAVVVGHDQSVTFLSVRVNPDPP